MTFSLIIELSAIVVFAALLGYLFSKLRQPILISYILTGFIVGPAILGLISSYEEIQALSELGIAFLLYAIGAELDIQKIKNIKKGIFFVTALEVFITFTIGFLITKFILNYTVLQSIFIGTIVSLSSTAVVMKYMSDQNLTSTLRARIMLSILLIQDFLIMFFLPLIMNLSESFQFTNVILIIGKILLIVAVAMLINHLIFKTIVKEAAGKKDLMFLISLASSFGFIWLSSLLNFSIIIGAFIGGLILTNYPYHLEIIENIDSIKSFFSMFFFVLLGMQITTLTNLSLMLFIVLFVLNYLIKPFILYIGTLLNKYDKTTSFYVSSGLSQISEFSLVLVQYAAIKGIFSDYLSSNLIIFISITMITTPYLLKYNRIIEKKLNIFLNPLVNFISKKFKINLKYHGNLQEDKLKDHIVIFGAGRMGSTIFESLLKSKTYPPNKIVLIDDNPEPIEKIIKLGAYGICGQADNEEILKELNLNDAKLIIITIPYYDVNKKILKHINLKEKIVFARAYYIQEAYELYKMGVDFVVVPQVLATNELIKEIFTYLEENKKKHKGLDYFYLEALKHAAQEERIYQRHHRYRNF